MSTSPRDPDLDHVAEADGQQASVLASTASTSGDVASRKDTAQQDTERDPFANLLAAVKRDIPNIHGVQTLTDQTTTAAPATEEPT
jgi:hypothetical protein